MKYVVIKIEIETQEEIILFKHFNENLPLNKGDINLKN
jgi:hypothetical protein